MPVEPEDIPRGRQSVLVGTFEGEPWIAYPTRQPEGQVWAVEMFNERFPTDVRADEAELIAGRPSLTPKTVALLNKWLKENAERLGLQGKRGQR